MKLAAVILLATGLIGSVFSLTDEEIAQFNTKSHIELNTGVQGSVTITKQDGDVLLVVSNGVPDHITDDFPTPHNPNDLSEMNYSWRVSNAPAIADSPSCLPEGAIGLALNGVPIYNPFTGWGTDAGECEVLDMCDGHPSPNGAYHYHIGPTCLMENTPNELIGLALDGFPIYGRVKADGTNVTADELDECHGMSVDGSYRYFVTTEYPYVMGCFKGTVIGGVDGRNCKFAKPGDVLPDCSSATGQPGGDGGMGPRPTGPLPPGRTLPPGMTLPPGVTVAPYSAAPRNCFSSIVVFVCSVVVVKVFTF